MSTPNAKVRELRARKGGLIRRGNLDAAQKVGRELEVVRAEEYIKRLVETFPPLTDEQRGRLAALLRIPAEQDGGAA